MARPSASFCAAALAALMACAPMVGLAQPEPRITSTFDKQAVAVRPGGAQPVPGQVAVGQRIEYVLSALAQGPGGVPATAILDVLSPNQTYVPGSLQLPPGWTATPNPPYTPNPPNQTLYAVPAAQSMLSFQLPVGGSGAANVASAGGDGMYPVPIAAKGRIYAVFHHMEDTLAKIDCWTATSLAHCPGFPRPISAAGDLTTLYNFDGAVVQDRYIYYAAARTTGAGVAAGLACWDTSTETPCVFHPVGTSAGFAPMPNEPLDITASAQIAGALVVPGTSRVLIAARNFLYCFDKVLGPASIAPCGGWSAAGVQLAPGHTPFRWSMMDLALEIGPNPTRVYVHLGETANQVQCVDLVAAAVCPGWQATVPRQAHIAPLNNWQGFDLHAIPAPGGHGAVCLHTIVGVVLRQSATDLRTACWTPQGNVADIQTLTAAIQPTGNALSSMPLGAGAGADRAVFARWNQPPRCLRFDAALNPAACTPWGVGLPGGHRDYGFAPDPLAPNRCVLVLGDAGVLYRFDGLTGRPGCPVTYQTTGDPMDFFCHHPPEEIGWSQIVIRDRPRQLTGGTIVVRDAATQAVIQTITVTGSNTYSISSVSYFNHPRLTIEFTPAYSPAGGPPVPAYSLEVQFTASEAPQICYQARVDSCATISNTATFGPLWTPAASTGLTGPTVGQSPWTVTDSVNLGTALEGPCEDCDPTAPLDLAVAKQALFAPWTVGGKGEFEIVVGVQQGTLDPALPSAPVPTFTDVLPAGVTFSSYTPQNTWYCTTAGQVVSCTYTGLPVTAGNQLPPVVITVDVVGPEGVLRNCAVLGPDANPANNESCDEVRIEPCLDLAITKEALGGPWVVGGTGVFQIRTRVVDGTLDPATAKAPTFVDMLPPGLAFVSATPSPPWTCAVVGQQVSCTYQGPPVLEGSPLPPVNLIAQVAGPPRALRNCAVLGTDFDASNNRGCDGVVIRGDTVTRDTLDLAIRKVALEEPWTVGGLGTFRIDTRVLQGTLNPTSAPTPTFVDVLPAGLTFNSVSHPDWACSAAGQQVSCTYQGVAVTAVGSLPPAMMVVNVVGPPDSVRNCAVLGRDMNVENNRSCDDVFLGPRDTVDISIRKTAVGTPWRVGSVQEFHILMGVVQGTLVPGVATFADVLPPGVTFTAYSPQPDWQCAVSGAQVACTYHGPPVVAPGALPPLRLRVNVVGPAGTMGNCVESGRDLNPQNNRSCIDVRITPRGPLGVGNP